jgi:fimbrial chaperone protein
MRAAWLMALLPAATAQALDVSPLRVAIPAGQTDGEVWLHNDSDRPWHGQARLYQWQQRIDREQLAPSTAMAVSPAELVLAPHARQRVRLVWLGPAPATEQGYRLILRPDASDAPVQMSLPVFIAGTGDAGGPRLTARLLDVTGPPTLELYNAGQRHARLADLAFVGTDGRTRPLFPGLAGYVLAGQTRRWTLPVTAHGYRGGRFSARQGDDPPALLDPPDPSIAPAAAAGL